MPVTVSSAAAANQIAPMIATGMPRTVLYAAQVDLRAAHGGVDVAEAGVGRVEHQVVVDVGGGDRGAEADQRTHQRETCGGFAHESTSCNWRRPSASRECRAAGGLAAAARVKSARVRTSISEPWHGRVDDLLNGAVADRNRLSGVASRVLEDRAARVGREVARARRRRHGVTALRRSRNRQRSRAAARRHTHVADACAASPMPTA